VRPGLREAYEVKDTIKGFEQTFIIEKPPAGEGPILLEGRVTTDLKPEGGIRLPNRVAYLLDGLPQLQYANLAVRDATGRALPARMDSTEDGQTISLWIDEEGQYPITVDPGIGGCSCGATSPQCWCTSVNLSVGEERVDPMHAALSPLKIDGSVGGAAFFYRTLAESDQFDLNKMFMLETGITGSSFSAAMRYIGTNKHLACSGHSFLADGRLFVAGGGAAQRDAYIWRTLDADNALQATSNDNNMCGEQADFGTPTLCAAIPSGSVGKRWYPTTIPLWNEGIMVIGGATQLPPTVWNNSYEFYTPPSPPPVSTPGSFECNPDFRVKDSTGNNNLCDFDKTCEVCWDYPHYHAIPEGLFLAAQLHATRLFQYSKLESNKQLWATADPNQPYLHKETKARVDSASVMLEIKLNDETYNQRSRVLLVGGYGDAPPPGQPAEHLDTAELFDAQAAPLAWRWTGCEVGQSGECQKTMQKPRQYPKTVLLPNNTVLIVGGEGNAIPGPGPTSYPGFHEKRSCWRVRTIL
jgi:hypothetical protein